MSDSPVPGTLKQFSDEAAAIVDRVAASVVRVDDGSRLTASGVVWSSDGVVVTTSHGVERDEDLAIEFSDGSLLPARLVGRDADTDIAVLKVETSDKVAIGRASGDAGAIGSFVLALARPGRSGLHATFGIVSARTDTQSGGRAEYLLHTDADLYPGFSGGPLIDMQGNMVGLTNLMFGRGRGIALGTPIVSHIAEALITGGRVQRGYLGIRTQQVALPSSIRDGLTPAQSHGLLIVQVEPGSPAESGNMLLGDTLLRFGDVSITDVDTLRRQLRAYSAGSLVTLSVLRGGKIEQLPVTLGVE